MIGAVRHGSAARPHVLLTSAPCFADHSMAEHLTVLFMPESAYGPTNGVRARWQPVGNTDRPCNVASCRSSLDADRRTKTRVAALGRATVSPW
jgi:hypothetical protein